MSVFCHPITFGNQAIGGNLFLAPMAGYTDIPFRSLCLKHGADLTYTEMISAEGLYRNGAKTLEMLKRAPNEKEYVIQLFMGGLEPIRKAVEQVLGYSPLMIDINCGCPVIKVTKTGSGSALMKKPELVQEMVKTIKECTDIPVSVKFRLGWDKEHENFLEFAQAAIDGGAEVLTLHARNRTEGYAPFAHWEKITELKKYLEVHAPEVRLIGSGDLFTAEDVLRMLKKTQVDAVMIARGAIGNPFIFEDAKALDAKREVPALTVQKRIDTLLEHLDTTISLYGEKSACHQMRKCATFYLKGMQNVSETKKKLSHAETRDDYLQACQLLTIGQ
ncbi:MAG: tRNA dihydrouridine synthase DusB [Sphaerochaetaceae bacterium]